MKKEFFLIEYNTALRRFLRATTLNHLDIKEDLLKSTNKLDFIDYCLFRTEEEISNEIYNTIACDDNLNFLYNTGTNLSPYLDLLLGGDSNSIGCADDYFPDGHLNELVDLAIQDVIKEDKDKKDKEEKEAQEKKERKIREAAEKLAIENEPRPRAKPKKPSEMNWHEASFYPIPTKDRVNPEISQFNIKMKASSERKSIELSKSIQKLTSRLTNKDLKAEAKSKIEAAICTKKSALQKIDTKIIQYTKKIESESEAIKLIEDAFFGPVKYAPQDMPGKPTYYSRNQQNREKAAQARQDIYDKNTSMKRAILSVSLKMWEKAPKAEFLRIGDSGPYIPFRHVFQNADSMSGITKKTKKKFFIPGNLNSVQIPLILGGLKQTLPLLEFARSKGPIRVVAADFDEIPPSFLKELSLTFNLATPEGLSEKEKDTHLSQVRELCWSEFRRDLEKRLYEIDDAFLVTRTPSNKAKAFFIINSELCPENKLNYIVSKLLPSDYKIDSNASAASQCYATREMILALKIFLANAKPINDIYPEESWKAPFVAKKEIGQFKSLGHLGYIDDEDSFDEEVTYPRYAQTEEDYYSEQAEEFARYNDDDNDEPYCEPGSFTGKLPTYTSINFQLIKSANDEIEKEKESKKKLKAKIPFNPSLRYENAFGMGKGFLKKFSKNTKRTKVDRNKFIPKVGKRIGNDKTKFMEAFYTILSLFVNNKTFGISQTILANSVGISQRTVSTILKELVSAGHLEIVDPDYIYRGANVKAKAIVYKLSKSLRFFVKRTIEKNIKRKPKLTSGNRYKYMVWWAYKHADKDDSDILRLMEDIPGIDGVCSGGGSRRNELMGFVRYARNAKRKAA